MTPRADPAKALVGRDEPLAVIDHALDTLTAGGPGRLLLVAGEAGVGKTALAQEAARRAQARDVTVAWGHGYEDDGAPAFWPWSEILGALLPPPGTTAREQVIGDDGPDLAPLLPGRERPSAASPAVGAVPADARFRLYQSAAALLGRLASERDVLVIFDDLHWADAPSIGVLRFVAHQLSARHGSAEGPRLMVLATYRPAEAEMGGALPEALATLTREPSVGRLHLTGLNSQAVAAFLHRVSGAEPAPDVVAAFAGRTDGNPFYLGELVRLLESEGGLTDPGAAAASPVPTGVRDVIRRRLARLPQATSALLGMAAVAGRDFDLSTLCSVGGLSAEDTLTRVDPALASEMIIEHGQIPGRYRFSHALVRDTIYSGLPGMRRAGLHAQVGESILARSGGNLAGLDDARVADLAHHFLRAAPVVGAEVAVPHLFAAAESALRLLAWERAEDLLRQALRLVQDLPSGPDRARLELSVQVPLGNLLAITRGQAAPGVETAFARTKELCQAAGGSGPVPELVPALYGLLVACWFSGNFAGGIEQGQVLLDRAAETGDPFAALAGHQGLGMIRAHQGEVTLARQHLETAIGIADALADPQLAFYLQGDPRMTCRGYLAFVLAAIGDHDGAAALTARAVEIVEGSEAPVSLASALLCDAWVSVVCGDVAHARARADATVVLSEQYCLPLPGSMAKVCQGWVTARSGRPAEGLARLDEGLGDLAATGIRIWLPALLGLRAEVLVLAGTPHEALVTLDGALTAMEDSGDRCYEARLRALHAETRAGLGPAPDGRKDDHGLRNPHQPG